MRHQRPKFAFLIVALLTGVQALAARADSRQLAFVDVTVLPMTGAAPLPRQTVVVKDGKIVALSPQAEARLDDDAIRIDGRGKFLLPGLADMHAHPRSPSELRLLLAHGVTTARVMFGGRRSLRWRAAAARGDLVPTLVVAGPIIDGDPPDQPGMAVARDPEDGRRIVAGQQGAGYDFVKVYHSLTGPAYLAILAEAHRRALPVAGHVTDAVGVRGALAARQASIEHLDGYLAALQSRDSPVAGKNDELSWLQQAVHVDMAGIDTLVAETRAAGTWNCPTLVAYHYWAFTEAQARASLERPEMRHLDPALLESWRPGNTQYLRPDRARLMRRRVELHMHLTRALVQAGAGVLLGADAGNPLVVPGVSALEELQLLVAAGLTPEQAIRAGTADAARFLGQAGRFGVVAPGARADLILLEADPLADIGNVRRRAGVMLRGRWLPESSLRRWLACPRCQMP